MKQIYFLEVCWTCHWPQDIKGQANRWGALSRERYSLVCLLSSLISFWCLLDSMPTREITCIAKERLRWMSLTISGLQRTFKRSPTSALRAVLSACSRADTIQILAPFLPWLRACSIMFGLCWAPIPLISKMRPSLLTLRACSASVRCHPPQKKKAAILNKRISILSRPGGKSESMVLNF